MPPGSRWGHSAAGLALCLAALPCAPGADEVGEWGDAWVDSGGDFSFRPYPEWSLPGQARLLSGKFDGQWERSALVLDGAPGGWHAAAGRMHRAALGACPSWYGVNAHPGEPVNAYRCDTTAYRGLAKTAGAVLAAFREDAAIRALLPGVYGVDAQRCFFGRGFGPLLVAQNRTMVPDSSHQDLCKRSLNNVLGISVITYPHDAWDSTWRGHFEFVRDNGTSPGEPVARFSPQPDRTIIFDGCIWHRATNPLASAVPVGGSDAATSPGLAEVLGDKGLSHFHFREWRFAVVMQLFCPYHMHEL